MKGTRMPVPAALRLRRESWGFALGSLLFMLGAVPMYQEAVGSVAANTTFFIGSLFFTTAGFIQLSMSGKRPPWSSPNRPNTFDWWAAAVQFVGTETIRRQCGPGCADLRRNCCCFSAPAG